MEGISHEACSLAGRLGLSKLIVFYDDNDISIDGHVQPWFADHTPGRFEAYGWKVVPNVDGHDPDAIEAAIRLAKSQSQRPTLICCKTMIGFGSPNKAGTHDVHGAPLGAAEIEASRRLLEWTPGPFEIPADVAEAWDARTAGARAEGDWQVRFAAYKGAHPDLAAEFERRVLARGGRGELPANWKSVAAAAIDEVARSATAIASRKASQNAIEKLAPALPELLGGSADLTGSNLTNWTGTKSANTSAAGNYVNYGVREFGMTAISNGVALHGGFVPYTASFLVFTDYARNGIRMAALMKQRHLMVYTHDSIGLGEDGPTHQPIEHLASLRVIPNLDVWRPADATETMVAWTAAIERTDGPSLFALSRQNLPALMRSPEQVAAITRGGYILADAPNGHPQVTIVATGSEVSLALEAHGRLAQEGVAARVVSMPCTARFDRQEAGYRNQVLPLHVPVVSVEAAHPEGLRRYVGRTGIAIGIDRFGESAPAGELYKYFGITADAVAQAARALARKTTADLVHHDDDVVVVSTN
jgi:transketolase